MKITDSAKGDLLTLINDNNLHGVRVEIHETCCGKSPVVGLDVFDEDEKPEEINGIQVVIPEEARDVTADLILDKVNDELVILNAVCGCDGGCSGCH